MYRNIGARSYFEEILNKHTSIDGGRIVVGVSQIQIDPKLEFILSYGSKEINLLLETDNLGDRKKLHFKECESLRFELLKSDYTADFIAIDREYRYVWINYLRDNLSLIWISDSIVATEALLLEWDASLVNEVTLGRWSWRAFIDSGLISYLPENRLRKMQSWIDAWRAALHEGAHPLQT